MGALLKNMDVQTAALLQLLSAPSQRASRPDNGGVRSVLQVKPQISWPVLDDKDNDVDDFIDEFESTVGLANDGLGMADREKLRVLANCLRQSRKQVYKVVTKAARRAGTLESDPGAVYDQVIERLREFREGEIEKQTRVTNQWDALVKGKLSALQFLPQFENCVAEMELHGLAKGARELLLEYLKRVGAPYRTEILKDRRFYPAPGGGEVQRQVGTWKEAHGVLVELEQLTEGSRALMAPMNPDEPSGKGNGKGRRGRRGDQKGGARNGAPEVAAIDTEHLKKICFQARDNKKCERPGCQFDHDPRRLAEARKLKAQKDQKPGGGNPAAPKASGAPKAPSVCFQFAKGQCTRGEACKFSHAQKAVQEFRKAIMAVYVETPAAAVPPPQASLGLPPACPRSAPSAPLLASRLLRQLPRQAGRPSCGCVGAPSEPATCPCSRTCRTWRPCRRPLRRAAPTATWISFRPRPGRRSPCRLQATTTASRSASRTSLSWPSWTQVRRPVPSQRRRW